MAVIYIHWPFCLSKCAYCDFNSYVLPEKTDTTAWFSAYKNVLEEYIKTSIYNNERITSVYFGGGTPSLMDEELVDGILSFIYKKFNVSSNPEITLEVNPKTLSKEKAKILKKSGINRVSVGIQSIYDKYLKMFQRAHSSKEAIECVNEMSNIFDNVSFDLIYNRPYQTLHEWEEELSAAFRLINASHVSLYELIIEENTKIAARIKSGDISFEEDEERSSDFFDITVNTAKKHGFEMYEVSNFSKPGFEGRHNLSYWKYEEYLSLGAGSHSRVFLNGKKYAIEQEKLPEKWLYWANNPKFELECLSETEIFEESLMMGLRAKCGFDARYLSSELKKKFNFDDKISNLIKNSYIICKDGGILMATYEGLKRLNLVIGYIIGV